jgi:hypothetical protein
MSKPKQVQTQNQETKYTEWTPSNTPDVQAVRDFKDTPESLAPSLQAQYDRAQQRNAARLNSSYNQNIPNTARLAMQQQGDRDFLADYGASLNQSAYDANKMKLGRQMGLAEMTLGRPLATSQSGTSTAQQKGGFWSSLAGGALGMASRFI